jgi:hypothetical protein
MKIASSRSTVTGRDRWAQVVCHAVVPHLGSAVGRRDTMSDDAEGFRAETLHVEARPDDGGATIVVVGEFDMTGTKSFWAHVS